MDLQLVLSQKGRRSVGRLTQRAATVLNVKAVAVFIGGAKQYQDMAVYRNGC
jgi:hypothetical protein